MAHGSSARIEDRRGSWKRRLRIGDLLIVIVLLAVDLSWLRAAIQGDTFSLFPLLGLLILMVGFVWRYVPRRWDRAGYAGALALYLVFLGIYVAAMNPILSGPLWRAVGLQ